VTIGNMSRLSLRALACFAAAVLWQLLIGARPENPFALVGGVEPAMDYVSPPWFCGMTNDSARAIAR